MTTINHIDTREFERLFRQYYFPLCQYAFELIADEEEAEDIVQQFFVQLCKAPEHFHIKNFMLYSHRSVRNGCINFLIRCSRRRYEELDKAMEVQTENPIFKDEDIYAYRTQTRKAILKIPLKSRRLLLLHYIRGLKYREIATLMGISINTVKSQLGVAYRILTRELGSLFPKFPE